MNNEVEKAREEREALLMRLYNAHLKALVEIVEKTPPSELSAPTLNAATKFLQDNAVSHQTIKDRESAGDLARGSYQFGHLPKVDPADFEY
jgi:hypothetical protein